jgi:thiamine-monophosphate kinase
MRDHASAAMDVSDGLAGDLAKLCAASGVSAAIDVSSVPLSATGRKLLAGGVIGIDTIVSGGDDYEILCTISEHCYESFAQQANQAAVAVTTIGTVIAAAANPRFLDAQGGELTLPRHSYSHF